MKKKKKGEEGGLNFFQEKKNWGGKGGFTLRFLAVGEGSASRIFLAREFLGRETARL